MPKNLRKSSTCLSQRFAGQNSSSNKMRLLQCQVNACNWIQNLISRKLTAMTCPSQELFVQLKLRIRRVAYCVYELEMMTKYHKVKCFNCKCYSSRNSLTRIHSLMMTIMEWCCNNSLVISNHVLCN